ncbi:MAG: GGDEF domain-containing protein [Planctomycetes bacterium]|nr:GGDEF domain-containing protein [Planctomycetota bacterium]
MSTFGPPRRVEHGRVVIVGCADAARIPQQVSQSPDGVSQTLLHTDNLFDALGEVAIATAAEPVAAVLIPVDVVRRSSANAPQAFRRVDPSVRLILLAESQEELGGIDAVADGFDEVLIEPVGAARLQQAREATQPAARTIEPVEAEAPDLTTPGQAEDQPIEQLGDTDLVEAILTDPAGIRDRAMQLIVQQTQWADLALTEDRPQRDAERAGASADVRYGRRSFGVLSSSRASESQLRPWADWLARWLALDRHFRDYREMAFHDELTGAGNRRFYEVFMQQSMPEAARKRRAVTVMVFDLDDFKHYNDQFGHHAGDEVLRETVRLLNSVIRKGDRVCRIGGDEFVVIFADPEGPREPGSTPPETVEQIAKRFQDQICQMKFPKLGVDAPGTLSISGGLATYPWDGADPASLLRHADQLALQSKKKGKNVITMGPGAQGICGANDPPA